jgi:hypothetical protein
MSPLSGKRPSKDGWVERGPLEVVAEQVGPAEDELKAALRAGFRDLPVVRAAFLVRVEPEGPTDQAVTLCLQTEGGPDPAVLARVGTIFKSIFRRDAYLDILFINAAVARDIRTRASAFYEAV